MTDFRKAIATGVLVSCAAAIGAYSGRAGNRLPETVRSDEAQSVFRTSGFAAAAARFGSYEHTERLNAFTLGPATVAELVQSAEVILVGRVASNRGVLAPSGDTIRTHYTVDVRQVLKGDMLVDRRQQVIVSVLGGRASLGNGTWGQLNVPYGEPPLNDHTYVFFLNRLPDDALNSAKAIDTPAADFWPAQGFSGIVALVADGRSLRSADRRGKGNRAIRGYETDAGRFVTEVGRIARHQPER